jgi:hypothetical protein
LSFDALSTLLSAIASLVSVGIAAYLVIQTRRESPDIIFVPVPTKIAQADQNQTAAQRNLKLLFQNVGARAGSLIDVRLVCPPESDSGAITTSVGLTATSPIVIGFPVVLQPYTTTLVDVFMSLRGNPNIKTLLVNLGNAARIEVNYLVSTKPSRKRLQGLDARLGYMPLLLE